MSMIQFSFALALFFIANLANGDNQSSILVIEANFPRGMSHYALHKKMAVDLASQEWVKKVVYLIPIVSEHERDLKLEQEAKKQHSKLTVIHELVELKDEPEEKDESHKPKVWENVNSKFEAGALTGTITRPDVFLELTKRNQLIDELKEEQFDIGIAEVFYYGAFPLLWLANVKHIVATSNMPSPPAFYHFMNKEYLRKIKETKKIPVIYTNTFDQDVRNSVKAYNDLDEKFKIISHEKYNENGEPPKFEDLFRQAKYYFINSQPFLDFKLPNEMLQNDKLKFIGGMAAINNNSNGNQQNPDEKVQFSVEELAAIEQAKQGKGLIIVSFGTVVETDKTPDQIFNILFNAFKQFSDYVFLWRFEDTTGKQQAAIDQHNNDNQKHIYTSKWLKQTALLADPTTRLFISHCGINSLNEAALYGVPLLCLPFFGDQPYNAAAITKQGFGDMVDIFDKNLSSTHVHDQIEKALEQSENMQKAKKAMLEADPVGTFVNTIKTINEEQKKRNEWLTYVAKHGDVKGNETLTPAEYAAMKMPKGNANFSPETIAEFEKRIQSLEKKQTKFMEEHKEEVDFDKLDDYLKTVEVAFKKEGVEATKKYGTLVLDCKKLLMGIFSSEGEAAWLDVFAFMQLAQWKLLKFAFEASKIQSVALDQMVNEDIWRQHLANRAQLTNTENPPNDNIHIGEDKLKAVGMQKVVIAGGGVNGLFAAYQLFRAGMDVVLVNDRLKYTRPQIVVYMTFWMANFRYFLGTKYNEIFENINSSGSGYLNKECGIISIRYMEQALLKRLEEFAQFVKEKQKNENNKSVEGCTKCVKMGQKKIEAKLELLYGYTVTGLEMFGKDKELKAILKKKGSLLKFSNKQMPVDLFLCMGGASDKLRAPLLNSKPVQRSKTVNYTNGIFRKVRVPEDVEKKINFRGVPAILVVKMDMMEKQLQDVKFDKLIEESKAFLPANVLHEFKDFTQQLLDDNEVNVFMFIENWEWFSLNTRTPKPMDNLLKEIDNLVRAKKYSGKKQKLAEFGRRILWKWCEAAFKYAYYYEVAKSGDSSTAEQYQVNIDRNGDAVVHNQEHPFSVDIDPSGTRSFNVNLWTMPNAAVERKSPKGKNSVVVAALGDALANTHYYSGGGMNTGKKGVEMLMKSVNEVISGQIKNKDEFATNLAHNLEIVTETAVMLTKKFIPNEIIEIAQHQTNEMEQN